MNNEIISMSDLNGDFLTDRLADAKQRGKRVVLNIGFMQEPVFLADVCMFFRAPGHDNWEVAAIPDQWMDETLRDYIKQTNPGAEIDPDSPYDKKQMLYQHLEQTT